MATVAKKIPANKVIPQSITDPVFRSQVCVVVATNVEDGAYSQVSIQVSITYSHVAARAKREPRDVPFGNILQDISYD